MKPVLIVDIDNTILCQDLRKQKILEQVLECTIELEDVRKDFNLENFFNNTDNSDILKKKFESLFFDDSYYEYLQIIDKSNEYLNILNDKVDIYYVSSRNPSHYVKTKQNIENLGFPKIDNNNNKLYLLEKENDLNFDDFPKISLEFKSKIISEILKTHDVVAGIGDTPQDILAYNNCGIFGILLSKYHSEKDIDILCKQNGRTSDYYSMIPLDNWTKIYECICSLLNDNAIKALTSDDTKDYSRWLFDLDNKAMLILGVSTFCGTTLFTFITSDKIQGIGWPVLVLAIIGLLFSLAAIVLSIRAFGSKMTHGINSSISLNSIYSKSSFRQNLTSALKIILGCKVVPLESPISDKDMVHKSQFKKFAALKFYYQIYGTFNIREIENLRLLSMRAANYSKIYPEIFARTALFYTLVIMFTLSIVFVINTIWEPSWLKFSAKLGTYTVMQHESLDYTYIKPLRVDKSYYNDDLKSMSEVGKTTLTQLYENEIKNQKNKCIAVQLIQDKTNIAEDIEIDSLRNKLMEKILLRELKKIDGQITIIIVDGK